MSRSGVANPDAAWIFGGKLLPSEKKAASGLVTIVKVEFW